MKDFYFYCGESQFIVRHVESHVDDGWTLKESHVTLAY